MKRNFQRQGSLIDERDVICTNLTRPEININDRGESCPHVRRSKADREEIRNQPRDA